jgi:phosphonatase-like hydrolase
MGCRLSAVGVNSFQRKRAARSVYGHAGCIRLATADSRQPNMLPELIVFDFAGTLLRDDGAVLAAYRSALRAHNIPFTEADLAARRGAAKRSVFRELAGRPTRTKATDELADRALEDFEVALRGEYTSGPICPIDGSEAVVRSLKESGARVALSSGFDRALVDLLVSRLGWEQLFHRVLAADDAPAGRPAPYLIFRAMVDLGVHDVARVAVVGDTPLDLAAAGNAGVGWVIGVLSGAHGVETLGLARHTHLLPSVADLPALFNLV